MKTADAGELKAMLLTLTMELRDARTDIAWLKKQMFEVCEMKPVRAVVTLPKSAQFGQIAYSGERDR